jgi:hypothetical protein
MPQPWDQEEKAPGISGVVILKLSAVHLSYMISIGAFTMTITTLQSRQEHMREKMAQSGREFMWSNAENPLLLSP